MNNCTLPDQFVERLRKIVPAAQWCGVLESFQQPKAMGLRVNTLRASTKEVTEYFTQQAIPFQTINWKSDALSIPHEYRAEVLDSTLYRQGLIYSQNLSSQAAPLILGPRSNEEVLDMCAAPGGKTLQIACMMRDQGRLAAVEKVKTRFFKLKANLQAHDLRCIKTYMTDATGLWRKTPQRFDRILLDAPCSSEARFQSGNPRSYQHWNLRKIRETARKQKKLLFSAIHCLKPQGTLVYSTCSFAPEENEAVIDHALRRFGDAITVGEINLSLSNTQEGLTAWSGNTYHSSLKRALRILPTGIMEGFFLCVLVKNTSTSIANIA